ncbi:alpha-glucosidase C-terminal domain-containing protein [Paenibacillus plantiphilus]|uniref:alpha-glucosidase C-terminal domain-containing protein n=1 Tax=Paenibacillus plantiphilus TaxID=2905650 RepID=UPI001F22B871|nr:alpha-glucosidase C-terminal domain-containing protein [Paenibacillus plantiphilus]
MVSERHAAFWNSELAFIRNTEPKVIAYSRRSGNEEYLILVNLSDQAATPQFTNGDMAVAAFSSRTTKEVIYRTGADNDAPAYLHGRLFIHPYETLIVKV